MFDRNSPAYRQMITDIAEAVIARLTGREDEPELPFRAASIAKKAVVTQAIVPALSELTPREHEVLQGIISGSPNKAIAIALGISHRTVEVHRQRIMEKLEVKGAAALIRKGLEAGVRPLPDADHKAKPEEM